MQAEIFDIKKFAVHDGDGIRTTVFFKGCPLRCVWCHNPEGLSRGAQLSWLASRCTDCGQCISVCPAGAHSSAENGHRMDYGRCSACGKCAAVCRSGALRMYGRTVTVDELMPTLLEDRDFYEDSGGGVTLSGGECLLQWKFCAELLAALKSEGIRTAVDTCGAVPREAFDAVIPYTDVFLYDVKAIDPAVHRRCTGMDNGQILSNLRYLNMRGCSIEVRIPYVPDYNSGEMPAIRDFLAELQHVKKVRVLAYHNYAADRYVSLGMAASLPSRIPEEAEMEAARAIF